MLPSKQFKPLVVSTFSIASVLRFKPIIIGGGTDSASANSVQWYEGQIAACMTMAF